MSAWMNEMTKEELIANSTLEQLADILIMERQHSRENKHKNHDLLNLLDKENSKLHTEVDKLKADMRKVFGMLEKYLELTNIPSSDLIFMAGLKKSLAQEGK